MMCAIADLDVALASGVWDGHLLESRAVALE